MIFAGPLKSFTKGNNGIKVEMSNAVFFVRDLINVKVKEENDMKCLSNNTDERFKIMVDPLLLVKRMYWIVARMQKWSNL